jgi:hypothetical protein
MVRSAEQQIAELAEQLGLPPSAAPTAGAAAAAAVRDTSPAVSQPQVAAAAAAAAAVDKPQRAGPSKDGQQPVAQQSKQQQEKQETPGEAAAGAQPAPPPQQQVEVVAASGRVLLKRDRSKQYTPTNKRHEGLQEAGEQPQSSDSSMQASQGDPNQQQHSDSGASRPRGGGSIMQRTRAALQLWKALRVRCPAAVLAMLGLLLLLLSTPAAGAFCCMHAWGWAGLLTDPCCRASRPPPPPPPPSRLATLAVPQSNASTPSTVLGKPSGGQA